MLKTFAAAALLALSLAAPAHADEMKAMCDETTMKMVTDAMAKDTDPKMKNDVMKADDVVRENVRHEVRVVRHRGEMDDRVRALGGAADGVGIGEIADMGVSEAGRGHAVEATHALTTRREFLHDGLADAPSGAGDEDEFGGGHGRSREPLR